MSNSFIEYENIQRRKFEAHTINMPWYLRLFYKSVMKVAYSAFINGLHEDTPPKIMFKRPHSYKEVKND